MKNVEEKKKERKLNKGQVEVLKLLYRYRFTTSELLAKAENQKHLQVTRSRLTILEKQGYIGRRYESSYKLLGKFATFYLLPKGLQYLKSIDVVDQQAIKMIYNDRKASDKFVDFCLAVCRTAQALISFYGQESRMFTRTELLDYDYFPQPLPDLYMSIKRKTVRHYFVDLYDDAIPTFVLVKKIKKYREHYESGEWEATDSDYPEIIVACANDKAEQRLRRKLLGGTTDDVVVYTCTIAGLESGGENNPFTVV
ncbi:MAG: hypothetical protein UY35_C0017G0024 [Candidatus Saccharibacteria bacterium GW2011_GWC2_48_9]|nr:MAG: hypothetical protein UY35_C0017G0024 [Candidatus Saccharibacteria bacterium GW2011_GWC2_48_9]